MKTTAAICCAILAVAAGLRTVDLSARPMHADESILADKFGALLEHGTYAYDPRDYHGPALLYLTLVPAWIAGDHRYVDLSEATLRAAPAAAGLGLVFLPLLLIPGLSRTQALAAAALTAISPAMVYFSRYYIPEMLLVCLTGLTIALMYRYALAGSLTCALAAGLSLGLMFATKETALIASGCMIPALAVTVRKMPRTWWRIAAGLAVAAAVVALLPGIANTLRAWVHAAGRGLSPQLHRHPWHYYLSLMWRQEAGIFLLGAIGLAAARQGLARFLAVYTLGMTAAYALIPYKTPWCALGFLHGWILLAGIGAGKLIAAGRQAVRGAAAALLALIAAHLTWQAAGDAFRYASDPVNPYVYAHTGRDVFTIRDRIAGLANSDPAGRNLRLQVISRANLWPLPWYLREFPHIEWWTRVGPNLQPAPVILASPDMEAALAEQIYRTPPGERELYVAIFERYVELRPRVELRGYARKSVWDRYLQTTSARGP